MGWRGVGGVVGGHGNSRVAIIPVTEQICDLGNPLSTKLFKIPQSYMLVAQEHRAGTVSSPWTWAKKEIMNE